VASKQVMLYHEALCKAIGLQNFAFPQVLRYTALQQASGGDAIG